ncbi:hypothetical protein LTR97_001166 [Elasticomyces elasticus]|uniref:BTB domain-containing protein n=1 Tax=Elasticomyces elasticus TaxID=574655 RepID=A0AAN8A5Q5_9PEZI|nr:hypothetical protein LTR97_001166 [Elasticomyces elasticus]
MAETTSSFAELYSNDQSSDITIVCGYQSFKVHRCVLDARCPELLEMLNDKQKDSYTIELAKDDPDVVEAMLYFCYHFSVPSTVRKDKETYTADFRVRVYCIASKYTILALRDTAATDLEELMEPLADFSNLQDIIAAIRSIEDVPKHHKNRLWDIAVPRLVPHTRWVVENDDFFALLLDKSMLNRSLLMGTADAVKGLPSRDFEAKRKERRRNESPPIYTNFMRPLGRRRS